MHDRFQHTQSLVTNSNNNSYNDICRSGDRNRIVLGPPPPTWPPALVCFFFFGFFAALPVVGRVVEISDDGAASAAQPPQEQKWLGAAGPPRVLSSHTQI
jgi:hypothetical protein